MINELSGSAELKVVSGAPLSLRVARKLARARIRGAGVLTRALQRLGMFDVIAQYELGAVKFGVPLRRIQWDQLDIVNYEAPFVDLFCRALSPLSQVTLIDCGADIGTFSALVCSRVKTTARILAIEPSEEAHKILSSNLANLAIPYQLITKAVSNFSGSGRLACPPDNPTDHARYLVPGEGQLDLRGHPARAVAGDGHGQDGPDVDRVGVVHQRRAAPHRRAGAGSMRGNISGAL